MERYSVFLPSRTFQLRFSRDNQLKFEIEHLSVIPVDQNQHAESFKPHIKAMGRKPDLTIITNQVTDPSRKLKQLVNLEGKSLNDFLSSNMMYDFYPLPGERSIVVHSENSNGNYSSDTEEYLSEYNLQELKKDFTTSDSSLFFHLEYKGVRYGRSEIAITVYYFHDIDLTTVEEVIAKCRTYKIIMKYPFNISRAGLSQ